MGSGIAQVAAAAGCSVVVVDPDQGALDRGRQNIASALATRVERGKMKHADAEAVASRIKWSVDLADVRDCSLVIEAIVERLDVKRALFAKIAALVAADTTIASNTSSLSITAMAEGLTNPSRLLGLHFFNPVPAMKLVEIIAGESTDPLLVESMTTLMRTWDKHPVVARDVPGFIVNRVARPYYAEAFLALDEGIEASVIDAALSESGGFRMGPLLLADMIGHDINYAAAASVFEGMKPQTRFRPQAGQERLVSEGRLGRKTGHGVYTYPIAAKERISVEMVPLAHVLRAPDARRFDWLTHAPNDVESDELPSGCISVDGVLIAYGDGRPLSERDGIDVLIDYSPDPAASPTLVATVRNAGAKAAAQLAAATGKRLLLIPDRPGLLVLRTLAQLANGAADAVRDGVAAADAIDEAMVYGANYPQGPLHWAKAYGLDGVKLVLDNIARATRDELYLHSSGFDLC
jgi:3-hydroxybutyryl-CoA dehydrogenase